MILFLAGCDTGPSFETKSDWLVHNPTEQAISLKIDGKTIQLAPQKSEEITLDAGKHTIDTPITGPQEFIVYVNAEGGLINPTLSTYVVEPINFIREGENMNPDIWGPMKKEVTIDGVTFEGMYKVHSDLFIDKDWTYAPSEKVPDEITTYDDTSRNAIRNKIYTKAEFFEVMGAKPLQADPPAIWQVAPLPSAPKFESEKMEQASQAYRAAMNEYYVSADPKRQIELQKKQMEVIDPMLKIYAMGGDSGLSQRDMENYNELIGAKNYKGARVLPKSK
jgi:hypothetical protein